METTPPAGILLARSIPDLNQLLDDCLSVLTPEGFPVNEWTTHAIARHFITTKKFIDTVKVLTLEPNTEVRERMLAHGVTRGHWSLPRTCTLRGIYQFCVWLKSRDGSVWIAETRRLIAMEKRAFVGQTVEDVSLLSALEAQIAECSVREERSRAVIEADLANLRRQIVLRTEEGERELAAVRAEFLPASDYIPMDEMLIGETCYKLYSDECKRKGLLEEPFTEGLISDVRASFSSMAIALHKTRFIQERARREALKAWVDSRVLELDTAGDRRMASTFRSYLAGTSGVAAEVRVEDQVPLAGEGRGRGTRGRGRLQ